MSIPDGVASHFFAASLSLFFSTHFICSFCGCTLIDSLTRVDNGNEDDVARREIAESLSSKEVATKAAFVLGDVWIGVLVQLIAPECRDREGGSRREVE